MPKTLDELFNDQNTRLFDMLFRHQVYLEGYKSALAEGYAEFLRRLYGEFAIYLQQTRYQSMDQFTKVQLTDFIRRFTIAQGKFYSAYTQKLIIELQHFLTADVAIHKDIMQSITGKNVIEGNTALKGKISGAEYTALAPALQADYTPAQGAWVLSDAYAHNALASGIYGIAVVDGSDDADIQLWANITNSPLPANGRLMLDMLTMFGTNSILQIQASMRKGYANGWTIQQQQNALLGKGNDFAGGLFGTLLNQHTALLTTIVQHVSTEVQSAVDSIYFEQYQWVAVLDGRTTQICIDRNGVVYIYGEGPLPPAHYFCRSKAVPVASGTHLHAIPDSYYDWLRSQPSWFLSDIMGHERATQLLAGELPAGNFAQISTLRPLTLSEFQGKVKYILGDNDAA